MKCRYCRALHSVENPCSASMTAFVKRHSEKRLKKNAVFAQHHVSKESVSRFFEPKKRVKTEMSGLTIDLTLSPKPKKKLAKRTKHPSTQLLLSTPPPFSTPPSSSTPSPSVLSPIQYSPRTSKLVDQVSICKG